MSAVKKLVSALMSFFSVIGWCLPLAWNASRYHTLVRIAGEIIRPLLAIIISFLGKYMIDLLAGTSSQEEAIGVLAALLSGLLIAALSRTMIQTMVRYSQAMQNDILSKKISLFMMDRSLNADMEYFDNPEYHDKLVAINRDATAMNEILWNTLTCISAAISFISVFIILFRVNVFYGVLMVATAVPSSIVSYKYTKSLYRLSLAQVNEHRQMAYCQSIASERAYAQDMRLFGAGEWLKQRYSRMWKGVFNDKRRATRKRAVLNGILDCLPEFAIILISADIAFRVLSKSATIGDYSLYTGLVAQIWGTIYAFSSSAMNIYDNRLKIDNIKSFDRFANRVIDDGTLPLESVESIEFDHVHFTYPGAKTKTLDDISIQIHRDEKIALVGLNGSGKSTLIKLLLRLYEPDFGSIKINGIDIKKYKLAAIRSNFSVYFQEMSNYSFTLRENFVVADSESADFDKEAKRALYSAYCDDILEKAQMQLDTKLTRFFDPDGIELSGGQHQKLALARAFYRKHTALILDEPSSSLDPMAEHHIFESLRGITDNKMTIFTSHRLSNVFLATRIIVLEKGKIIEDGSQLELLKNKQRYAELFRYQQERYASPSDVQL